MGLATTQIALNNAMKTGDNETYTKIKKPLKKILNQKILS